MKRDRCQHENILCIVIGQKLMHTLQDRRAIADIRYQCIANVFTIEMDCQG